MTEKPRLSPLFTWRGAVCDGPSPASSTQRLVALVLSLHMSERGDSCFPGIDTIAAEAGLGRTAVKSAIAALERIGFLEVHRPARQKGRGRPNEYRATIPGSGHVATPSWPEGVATIARRGHVASKKGSPRGPEVVSEDVKRTSAHRAKPKPNPDGAKKARELRQRLERLAANKAMGS